MSAVSLAGLLEVLRISAPIVIDAFPIVVQAARVVKKWFDLARSDEVTPDQVADFQQAVNSFQLEADKFPMLADAFTKEWQAARDAEIAAKKDKPDGT